MRQGMEKKGEKMKRFIIYDIPNVELTYGRDVFFNADPYITPCGGCFGCWIKTPGKCVISDRAQITPEYLAKCGEIVIISPIYCGGYSYKIKAVIDRSIGYLLPYFRIVQDGMHHTLRYKKDLKFTVCFYGERDAEEEEIARAVTAANAINFGASDYETLFFKTAEEAKEAVL